MDIDYFKEVRYGCCNHTKCGKSMGYTLLLAKNGPLNLSEIADTIETSKATTFRILTIDWNRST